jgi:inositol transport system substrate-binding protein
MDEEPPRFPLRGNPRGIGLYIKPERCSGALFLFLERREEMKKTKKNAVRGILLAAALLCVSAGQAAAKGQQDAAGGAKKFKVAYIVQGLDDIWHNVTATSTKKYMEANDPEIQVDIFDGKSKTDQLLNLLETVSNSDYNLIIGGMHPDMDTTSQVEYLRKKGVPVISYSFEKEGTEKLYSTYVCNEYDLGRLAAERAAEELPQGARILYLAGPVYSGSILRRKGLQEGLLDKRPDVKLLDEQIADFLKNNAMEKMDDWLQRFGKVDGVLAANDAMALGAIESLRANGYKIEDTKVYGLDSVPEALIAIKAGEMRFSSFQDPMAYVKAFYQQVEDFKNGKIDVNFTQKVYIPADYTDSSNVDARIAFYREAGAMK